MLDCVKKKKREDFAFQCLYTEVRKMKKECHEPNFLKKTK